MLAEGGVGQAVAKGIDHFLVIVPPGGGGKGAHLGIGVALTHDHIGVAGLVVAVAGVDALGFDEVEVTAVHGGVQILGGILPRHYAVVGHGRGGSRVRGKGVWQGAAGVDFTH